LNLKQYISDIIFIEHSVAILFNCFAVSMEVDELRSRFEEQSAVGGNLSTSLSSDMVISS